MKDKYITWILTLLIAVNIIISACIVRDLQHAEEVIASLPEDRHITLLCNAQKDNEKEDEEEPSEVMTYMGTFRATAYCSCEKCCGKWSGGPTASGTMPMQGRTIASDWDVLPAGTEVYIDGLGWRTVEDKGSAIQGQDIDIYMQSHEAAIAWGVQEVDVWIMEE